MKRFNADGNGLFQDDSNPIHRAPGVTECFYEYENYVNPTAITPKSGIYLADSSIEFI